MGLFIYRDMLYALDRGDNIMAIFVDVYCPYCGKNKQSIRVDGEPGCVYHKVCAVCRKKYKLKPGNGTVKIEKEDQKST